MSVDRKYRQAPYAFSLASQKPCIWILMNTGMPLHRLNRSWFSKDSCSLNSSEWPCISSGICLSQATCDFHRSWIINIAFRITGPGKPSGSKSFAMSDKIVRLVISLTTSVFLIVYTMTTPLKFHEIPKVLIVSVVVRDMRWFIICGLWFIRKIVN